MEKQKQNDHIIPQKTIKDFFEIFPAKLKDNIKENGLWIEEINQLHSGISRCMTIGHGQSLKQAFLNWEKNIVEGYKASQSMDDIFDPELDIKKGDVDIVSETPLSLKLRAIYESMRLIINFYFCSIVEKPKTNIGEVEEYLVPVLKSMTENFLKIQEDKPPIYNKDIWYEYNGNIWKKRCATWLNKSQAAEIHNELNGHIETIDSVPPKTWSKVFLINFMQNKKNYLLISERKISVNITIDNVAWKHIYERHYLPTFTGTIEGVNTFWKKDPLKLFNEKKVEEGSIIDEVSNEIFEIIKLKSNLYTIYSENFENESFALNDSYKNIFIQGNAEFELVSDQEIIINVELESLAPQNSNWAFAVLPEDLNDL